MRQIEVRPTRADRLGPVRLEVAVYLGRLLPADVHVEAVIDWDAGCDGGARGDGVPGTVRLCSTRSYRNGTFVFEAVLPRMPAGGPEAITVHVRPADRGAPGRPIQPVTRSTAPHQLAAHGARGHAGGAGRTA
jgi:hypothetical protein